MKITVDRPVEESDHLTFIINVNDPHKVALDEGEFLLLKELDECQKVAEALPENNKIKNEVKQAVHRLKGIIFERIISNIKFSLENELEAKFNPICQEVYNWIYDHQEGSIKQWLQEFDPQRVKYYFDNDKTVESDFGDDDGEQMDSEQSFDD